MTYTTMVAFINSVFGVVSKYHLLIKARTQSLLFTLIVWLQMRCMSQFASRPLGDMCEGVKDKKSNVSLSGGNQSKQYSPVKLYI
uniref:Uncharacterized protein n=1 Tax=Anguilla anguilla TaxID=7936 RepID=A0A0E9TUL9_ANGAN